MYSGKLVFAQVMDGCSSFSSAVQRGPGGAASAWQGLLDPAKAG